MRYRLINQTTKEESICEKVVVDGSDYYVNDTKIVPGDYIQRNNDTPVLYTKDFWFDFGIPYKKVIATSNPNINIPKVIDLIERDYVDELDARRKVAKDFRGQVAGKHPYAYTNLEVNSMIEGYLEGYNKSQESYPFSEEDLIDFATFRNGGDVREEFNLWKQQRIKTLYYE